MLNFERGEILASLSQVANVIVGTVAMLGERLDSEWLPDMSHTTRAGIVHDRVMAELMRQFDGRTDIEVKESNGLIFLVIQGIRFRVHCTKNPDCHISINRTLQTRQWNSGRRPIPGLPDPNEHYHIVFVIDQTWSKVRKLIVGSYEGPCPVSKREIDLAPLVDEIALVGAHGTSQDAMIPTLKLKPQEEQLLLGEVSDENSA
jgi:hypothetical protein